MGKEEQNIYEYFLDNVPGIGGKTAGDVLDYFGSAKEAYLASERELLSVLGKKRLESWLACRKDWDIEKKYEELLSMEIQFISICHPMYPERLREIPDRPFGIYVRGKLPPGGGVTVAVVGARKCSEYGKYIAREFGRALAEAGIHVVSGLARGIDGISQQAVLEGGGRTYGVLGCGVDICYPPEHRSLYERILKEEGGILSAYPPGTQPRAPLFPPRNRIISGLADALLVVEAGQKSGTLITVDMALEQGRDIYCVPGRLTDALSRGCNRLLQQGAGLVLSPGDFLSMLQKERNIKNKESKAEGWEAGKLQTEAGGVTEADGLTGAEKEIWNMLDFYPLSLEEIRSKMREKPELQAVTLQDTLYILMRLTLLGLAESAGGSRYVKKKNQHIAH